jgi:peroxiredoxin
MKKLIANLLFSCPLIILAQQAPVTDSISKKEYARLGKQVDSVNRILRNDVFLKYAKENPASPIAVLALENAAGNGGDLDPESVGPVFDHLSEANRRSEKGVAFQTRIEDARKTSIGHMAPDFTQNDTLEKPVTLSSFHGKYVLIDFWASWCGPCRLENPNLVAMYEKYSRKGFQIIGVSLDQPGAKDKWLGAIHKDGLTWTQVSDLRFWKNAVAEAYGIKSIPQNFLVDPSGKIIAKSLRGEDLENKLKEIYK